MKVYPMRTPPLNKLGNQNGGDLVTLYNDLLQPEGTVIVCRPLTVRSWPEKMDVFDPETGMVRTVTSSMRCFHHRGAAIVTDYVEGT